ncbi:MAG: hypothetical protein QF560_04930 [SAR324 cluster bacterium]|nr:hypothetical protein [SAR324 cluster bacterium]HJO44676.1 hypothetical protein [SAR324 cluster bacterium]
MLLNDGACQFPYTLQSLLRHRFKHILPHPPIAPLSLLSMPPERYCGDIMLLGYVYLGLDASLVICFQNAN